MPKSDPIILSVMKEERQDLKTRQNLYASVEKELGRPVLSYFTSFVGPGSIDQTDVDMLEQMLHSMNLKSGLALMISSAGGDIIAAERIINLCRKYSGTGDYWAIVPTQSKIRSNNDLPRSE